MQIAELFRGEVPFETNKDFAPPDPIKIANTI